MSEKNSLNLSETVNQEKELTGGTWPRHGEDCMQPKIHSLEALNEKGEGGWGGGEIQVGCEICALVCFFSDHLHYKKRQTKQKKQMEEVSLF